MVSMGSRREFLTWDYRALGSVDRIQAVNGIQ